MKVATRNIDALLEKPGPNLRAALLYGPDRGLVRERADRLARAVVEDLADPFRVSDLSAADIKHNPAGIPPPCAPQRSLWAPQIDGSCC